MISCIVLACLAELLVRELDRCCHHCIPADPSRSLLPNIQISSLQQAEQLLAVEAVGQGTQDSSLSDPIVHAECARNLIIPSNIGKLLRVNEDQESGEDGTKTSLEHLGEQLTVDSDIKGLGHVHGAHEDF